MKSKAATVPEYLDSLPPDRKETIETVRRFLLDNLGREFEECMQYGVIAYCVPHSIWPAGHHTRPELPLMYMGLSSQKNDMVVYMLFLLHNEPEREWFETAWNATGKKLHFEVSGAGCCLRFKKLEDISLEVIGQAIHRMPVRKYLEDHAAIVSRLGKKSSSGSAVAAKKAALKPQRKTPAQSKTPKRKSK